jgi:DNA polymerase III gamma/tau subunit
VYVLDECHQLTKDAGNALLKVFEDCIGTNVMILCTTQPMDVLQTLRTRAVTFEFKLWTQEEMEEVARLVFVGEGYTKISEKTVLSFTNRAYDLGITSPRAFLNAIDKVVTAGSFAVLDAAVGLPAEVRNICVALLNGDWPSIAAAWNESLEPEQVRIAACAYLRNALLAAKNPARASKLADALKELAHRIDDTVQENNVVARLALVAIWLSEIPQEDD